MPDFRNFIQSLHRSNNHELIEAVISGYDALFEATIDEVYDKYYSKIDRETFNKINNADPTSMNGSKKGKYLDWLLRLYKSNSLKYEDLYKATEYLNIATKYGHKLNGLDVNKLKSLTELYDAIKVIHDKITSGNDADIHNKKQNLKKGETEVEVPYEDDEWKVVIPLTQRASCRWGSGTQWCTAADSENNAFDEYNSTGKLYIFVNKRKPNIKYQIHPETASYMDSRDEPFDPVEIFKSDKNLIKFMLNNSLFVLDVTLKIGTIDNVMAWLTKNSENAKDMIDYSSIVIAIQRENIEMLKALLTIMKERYAIISRKTIEIAIETENPEILKYLLDAMNDNEKPSILNDSYLLKDAVQAGNIEILKILINSGVKVHSSALQTAISNDRSDMVNLLIDAGAHPNDYTFNLASDSKNSEIISTIRNKFALNYAIKTTNDVNKVKELLANGHTPDADSLLYAISVKNVDIVKVLIDVGAPVSKHALNYAITGGTPEIVSELLKTNERLDDKSMKAAMSHKGVDRDSIINLILDAGVKVSPDDLTKLEWEWKHGTIPATLYIKAKKVAQ